MSEKNKKGVQAFFAPIFKSFKDAAKTLVGEPLKISGEIFKSNSFIRAFLEESKLSPKPNYEKRTADAVEGIKKFLEEREK